MFKKASLLLILSVTCISLSYGQYEDDAPIRNPSDTSVDGISPTLSEKLAPGLEFMLTASAGVFFTEISPFIAYKVADPVIVGIGVHGSFLSVGNYGNYSYYGTHAFGRVTLAQQFFVQGEFRVLNGKLPGTLARREWVATPIAEVGMMYGPNSWLMIGYAFDTNFQAINPFQAIVYRFGFYF